MRGLNKPHGVFAHQQCMAKHQGVRHNCSYHQAKHDVLCTVNASMDQSSTQLAEGVPTRKTTAHRALHTWSS